MGVNRQTGRSLHINGTICRISMKPTPWTKGIASVWTKSGMSYFDTEDLKDLESNLLHKHFEMSSDEILVESVWTKLDDALWLNQ